MTNKKRTAAEKEKVWKEYCFDYTEQAEILYSAGGAKIAGLMILELMGGDCPNCKTPWEKIVFENNLLKGEYYKPACNCYLKCQRCGKELYIDHAQGKLLSNNYTCTNCGYAMSQERRKKNIDNQKAASASYFLEKYYKQIESKNMRG
jgi:predicted RNA-binding Zn-ribbon protein involved in translation (DUF1610 family)